MGTLLVLLGFAGMLTALVGVAVGHVRWARLGSRKACATALGAAFAVMIAGSALTPTPVDPELAAAEGRVAATASASPSASRPPSPRPSPSAPSAGPSPSPASATPSPAAAPADPDTAPPVAAVVAVLAAADSSSALAAVAGLPVKGRAPKTGYDRALFGQAWADVDRNGCDTRNDILRRDLTNLVIKAGTRGCKVLEGDAAPDVYTGTAVHFVFGGSSEIDVDHVVSLSDAWQKGAQGWDAARRTAFANDPLELLAVSASANRSKSDGDTATWLPPNKGYRCAFVARQVAVKKAYGLWVTAAERDAMVRVLSDCPREPLPVGAAVPLAAETRSEPAPAPPPRATQAPPPKATPAPPPRATAAPPPPPAEGGTDPRFGTCKEAKANGYGPYRQGTDPEYDWYRDGDKDGVNCE